MKEYKNSNHKHNINYALPLIEKHGIKGRFYKWAGGYCENGEWHDLIKIDGVLFWATKKEYQRA